MQTPLVNSSGLVDFMSLLKRDQERLGDWLAPPAWLGKMR